MPILYSRHPTMELWVPVRSSSQGTLRGWLAGVARRKAVCSMSSLLSSHLDAQLAHKQVRPLLFYSNSQWKAPSRSRRILTASIKHFCYGYSLA